MADRTQENLARIRACDADWNENDHPRADNGQFTSGSGGGGAKVSKLQSGGKAKVQQLKNVSGALAGVNAGIEKADNTFAARMDRTRKAGAAKHKDLEQREDAVRKKYEGDWRYGHMYGKLKNKPGMERLAERVKNKAKSREAQKRDELAGLEKEYHQIQNEYDPIVGERQRAANKQYEKTMNQLYPQKQALEAEQKKFQGAKKTLEKAKPGIQKMRENAKAAAPAASSATHPMAAEVQRDIDYWHQMQYGGRPSEKQKQDTIESMRMQYDDYLKTAEKNWKLAQSVPNLDEETRNKYKQKYETAKGKVEALKQMTEQPAQAAAPAAKPAQKKNDLQPAPIARPTRNASPEQAAAKFNEIASAYKKLDTDVAKYARQAAKVAAKGGEAAAAAWLDKTIAKIDSDPDSVPFVKGYHRGRLRMLMEQYNK